MLDKIKLNVMRTIIKISIGSPGELGEYRCRGRGFRIVCNFFMWFFTGKFGNYVDFPTKNRSI